MGLHEPHEHRQHGPAPVTPSPMDPRAIPWHFSSSKGLEDEQDAASMESRGVLSSLQTHFAPSQVQLGSKTVLK